MIPAARTFVRPLAAHMGRKESSMSYPKVSKYSPPAFLPLKCAARIRLRPWAYLEGGRDPPNRPRIFFHIFLFALFK